MKGVVVMLVVVVYAARVAWLYFFVARENIFFHGLALDCPFVSASSIQV